MTTVSRPLSRLGYGLLLFLAFGVALFSFRYATFNAAVAPDELRPNMEGRPVIFVAHTFFAAIAMLVGVLQFIPRTRRSAWHRIAGRVYVVCCLIAAPAGFVISFHTTAGPFAGAGFAALAVLWFGATARAYWLVRQRRYTEHRKWMIRSYALTCAAITLRIMTAVGGAAGLDFYDAYIFAAWACWLINLALVETWLATRGRRLAPVTA